MDQEARVTVRGASVRRYRAESRASVRAPLLPPRHELSIEVEGEGVIALMRCAVEALPIPADVALEELEADVTISLRPRGSAARAAAIAASAAPLEPGSRG